MHTCLLACLCAFVVGEGYLEGYLEAMHVPERFEEKKGGNVAWAAACEWKNLTSAPDASEAAPAAHTPAQLQAMTLLDGAWRTRGQQRF